MSFLETALLLIHRGWSIIPIGKDKKPGLQSWKPFQTARATPQQAVKWFGSKSKAKGLGVILGPVSGNLGCRDFDTKAAYHAWAAAHPDLAAILPAVETGRGFHVYFTTTWIGYLEYEDGELRCDSKHYCVLPPSPHPDGSNYVWRVDLPSGALPVVDPFVAGLANSPTDSEAQPEATTLATERAETAEWTERAENRNGSDFSVHSAHSVISVDGDEELSKAVEAAIEATLPTVPGARNAALFNFARHLKAIPQVATMDHSKLRRIAYEWFERSLPIVTTKTFDVTWSDFLHAYDHARFPLGHNPLSGIKEAAQRMPNEFTDRFDCPKTLLLIKVCKLLQQNMQQRPFFISTREAARILEVDPTAAWKRLKMLEREGLLRMAEAGSEYRATRYHYLGGK